MAQKKQSTIIQELSSTIDNLQLENDRLREELFYAGKLASELRRSRDKEEERTKRLEELLKTKTTKEDNVRNAVHRLMAGADELDKMLLRMEQKDLIHKPGQWKQFYPSNHFQQRN